MADDDVRGEVPHVDGGIRYHLPVLALYYTLDAYVALKC